MKSALASLLSAALVASHAAALTTADAAGTWVQLIPAGTFSGRDGRGPYDAGGKTEMEAVIATTKRLAGTVDLVIDYDHQSVFAAVPGVGGTARAAGWIKEIEVRDGGIFGRVEWTQAAAAAIKAGEYRYLSPVFLHEKSGRVLAIRMAGLTNTPNLDMVAVAASTLLNPATIENGEGMDKILAALGLAKGTNEDGVVAAINAMLTSSTAIAVAAGLTKDAKSDDVLAAVNSAFADRKTIATTAGLKAEAATAEIVTAVQSAMSSGAPDPTKFVPIEQVTQLQKDVKALQDTTSADKAEEAVATAIKDGKLAPALKDWGLALHKAAPEQFETFVGNAPVLTAPQLKAAKKEGGDSAALDDAQLAAVAVMGVDPAAYAKTLAAEAAELEARR